MQYGVKTYWRFKKDREWKIAYPQPVDCEGLVRMCIVPMAYNAGGVIVSEDEIEIKQTEET